MSWAGALATAFLVVLPRPATWTIALAAFLVRGGLLVFLLPILVLPSPVGLSNLVAPMVTGFVFGGLSPEFAALVGGVFLAFFAWLVVGGTAAALAERALVEAVVSDDEVATGGRVRLARGPRRGGRTWRIVMVRLAAYVPLALALGWGAVRVVQAIYRELTLPSDIALPIAWRVVIGVPDAIIAIVAAWVLGELLGALASRRLVLRGQSLDAAYLGAWADLLRRPVGVTAAFLVPTVVLLAVTVPLSLAAGVVWEELRVALVLSRPGDELLTFLALVGFVATWAIGLALAGLLSAWRSAAATLEAARAPGTFGLARRHRPGEWNESGASGSL